jgi:4-aminobutyrate aminotransferase-like enzyme
MADVDPLARLGDTLVGLATRPRGVSRDLALRLARERWGLEGEADPLHGERNENYRIVGRDGRALILKLSGAGEDMGGVELQIAALAHLARVGPDLPVPRVIPTRDGRTSVDHEGVRVFAVSVLPGRPLDELANAGSLLGPLGALIAEVGRGLRGFHHGWVPPRLAWDPKAMPALAPAARLIADPSLRAATVGVIDRVLAEVLPRLPAARCQFIHNDGNLPNVLADESGSRLTGLVDFGDMTFGPVVLDLAVACSDNVADGDRPLETMLPLIEGFTGVAPLEDEEIPLLLDCTLARLALGLAIMAWRRTYDPDGVDQLVDWEATASRTLPALLALGGEAALAAFRRAARRAVVVPSLRPARGPAVAPDRDALIARRKRLLGANLSLTYRRPLHIVRGDGVWLHDADGRAYLDVYNNVPQVGHCHPHVVEAVARQIATLNTNTRYLHETVLDYAERLTATMPEGLDVCLFVNSGSEANDVAWRIARTITGNAGALVMENAYHGITEAIAALSPYEVPDSALAPHVRTLRGPDTYRGPWTGADAGARFAEDADRAIASLAASGMRPAILMVDSGFTSNGIPDVPPGYYAAIAAKARAAGALIAADEVQFGFARPGSAMWGFAAHGVVPDLVCLGKPVGNGHPLGVVVTRADILERFTRATDFFSTFGGNPVSAAAGLAVLEVIEREGLQGNARTTGAYFRKRLEEVMQRRPRIGDVRGFGLLLGVEIVASRATKTPDRAATEEVKNRMRERGVLVGTEGVHGNVLKIRPPLPFRPDHADLAAAALDQALAEMG